MGQRLCRIRDESLYEERYANFGDFLAAGACQKFCVSGFRV
jgi:hypothetical protein